MFAQGQLIFRPANGEILKHWISEVFPEKNFLPQHLKIKNSSDRKERDFISTTLD